VEPLPGDWMYVFFAVMGVAAVLVCLGLFYRPAMIVLWFLYTWKFLIEKSVYMNHYYLIGLLCFLFIFIPAHHTWSLDRRRHPEWSPTVPRWTIYLLRLQLFIVYFYGAIAKLNPDWLRGEPMLSAITARTPGVPEIATHFPPALLAYAIAYGGILNDAMVPILLSVRRTRVFGFICALVFHVLNEIFLIGLFSYLMSVADRSSSIPTGRAASRHAGRACRLSRHRRHRRHRRHPCAAANARSSPRSASTRCSSCSCRCATSSTPAT
jgi:hypothetical protein